MKSRSVRTLLNVLIPKNHCPYLGCWSAFGSLTCDEHQPGYDCKCLQVSSKSR